MEQSMEIVKLNVGGHKFMTTAGTLVGSPFFAALLRKETPAIKDDEGNIFIDRDGQYFGPLLSFMRTGELDVPLSMSKRSLEREALFFLIDLRPAGGVVTNPLSKTSVGLGGILHSDLRSDGVYLQRLASGHFVGYYVFSLQHEEVRFRSIHNLNANELVYARPSHFTRLAHPWVVMHFGSAANPAKMIATVQSHGLTIEWRYPPRPDHRKPLQLRFWPSTEPLIGTLFSDEMYRAGNQFFVRVFFADRQRATVTIVERSGRVALRKQASYLADTRDGLCFVTLQNTALELSFLSLGGLLIEVNTVVRKVDLARGRLDLSSKSIRVLVAVGTEPDPNPEPERNEIDIYEFLRTYQPAFPEDDSSEVGGGGQLSEELDLLQMEEPYVIARHPARQPVTEDL